MSGNTKLVVKASEWEDKAHQKLIVNVSEQEKHLIMESRTISSFRQVSGKNELVVKASDFEEQAQRKGK